MNKLLSIIVPSYNMEAYLPKCLGSLVGMDESYLNLLDVIVVNDGSKDRTSAIAHEYAQKWPQTFKVIDKPNGNYGSCINAALPVAQGTWVKVLDADDWFKTENLPGFLDYLSQVDAGVDLVLSNFTRFSPTGEVVQHAEWAFPTDGAFDFEVFADTPCPDLTMHGYAYRTAHVRGLGYRQKEGVSYSDIEWACIPLVGIQKLAYYPHDVYQYLAGRPGQTMDAERYAANFGMGAEVVLHMIEAAQALGTKYDDMSYRYVRNQLVQYLQTEYRIGCFGDNGRKVNFDLSDFDRRLKSLSPEDYEKVASVTYSARFPYRYVEGFRRGALRDRFLLFLGRAYPWTRRLIKR